MLQIITNHQWRDFIYGYELPDQVLSDFDWIDHDELDSTPFIKYRDWYYTLDQFMNMNFADPNMPKEFKEWHGYHSDSFFSGILIRLSENGEQYQIATYIS